MSDHDKKKPAPTDIKAFVAKAAPLVVAQHISQAMMLLGNLIDERKRNELSSLPIVPTQREEMQIFFSLVFNTWLDNLKSLEEAAKERDLEFNIFIARLNNMDECAAHLLMILDLHIAEVDNGVFSPRANPPLADKPGVIPCLPHGTVICPLIDYFLAYFESRQIDDAVANISTRSTREVELCKSVEALVAKMVIRLCLFAFDRGKRLGEALILFHDIFEPADLKRAIAVQKRIKLSQKSSNEDRFSSLELNQEQIAEMQTQIFQSQSLPSDLRSLLVSRRFLQAKIYMIKVAQDSQESFLAGLDILLDYDLLDIFVELIKESGLIPGHNSIRRLISLLPGWLDSRPGSTPYESQPMLETTVENLYELMINCDKLPMNERVGAFVEIHNRTAIDPSGPILQVLIEQVEAKDLSASRKAIMTVFKV